MKRPEPARFDHLLADRLEELAGSCRELARSLRIQLPSSPTSPHCSSAVQATLDQPSALPLAPPARMLLTANEVADLLRIHPRTLRRMRKTTGLPPPVMIGGKPLWRRRDIETWIEKGARS